MYSLVNTSQHIIRGPFLIKITEAEYYFKNNDFSKSKETMQSALLLITPKTYFFYISWFYLYIQIILAENSTNFDQQIKSLESKISSIILEHSDANFTGEMKILKKFFFALTLKRKTRFFEKGKAMNILHSIVFEESIFQELIIVNYFDLLLDELKLYNQIEVINEFKELLNKLVVISKLTNNFQLLMQSFFLMELLNLLNNESQQETEKNVQIFEGLLLKYPEFNLTESFESEKIKFFDILNLFSKTKMNIVSDKYVAIQTLQLSNYIKDMYKLMQQKFSLK